MRPIPVASMTTIATQIGSVSTLQPEKVSLSAVSTAIIPSATTKSRSAPGTADIGNSIRGKNTFCTMLACVTSEVLDFVMMELNRFQAKRPAYAKTTYGTPPAGRPATVPKTKEKMPAASSGWSTTHTAPNAVWRYRNLTSRIASDPRRSRKTHSSRKSIARQPRLGRTTMTGTGFRSVSAFSISVRLRVLLTLGDTFGTSQPHGDGNGAAGRPGQAAKGRVLDHGPTAVTILSVAPETNRGGPSLEPKDYLTILRRRWLVIAIVTAIVLGVALYHESRLSKVYEASGAFVVGAGVDGISDAATEAKIAESSAVHAFALKSAPQIGTVATSVDPGDALVTVDRRRVVSRQKPRPRSMPTSPPISTTPARLNPIATPRRWRRSSRPSTHSRSRSTTLAPAITPQTDASSPGGGATPEPPQPTAGAEREVAVDPVRHDARRTERHDRLHRDRSVLAHRAPSRSRTVSSRSGPVSCSASRWPSSSSCSTTPSRRAKTSNRRSATKCPCWV